MTIDKISRSSDPHEPEGSGRKMRNVGDKFKKIERMQEIDPENRKKQKWEMGNDSPFEVSKSKSYESSNNAGAPDYTPKTNAPSPNTSSPYGSNAPSNNTSSNSSSSNTNNTDSNSISQSGKKDPDHQNTQESDEKGPSKKNAPKFMETIEIDTPGITKDPSKAIVKGTEKVPLKPLEKEPLDKSSPDKKNEPTQEVKKVHTKEDEQEKHLSSPLESALPKENNDPNKKNLEKASPESLVRSGVVHDKKQIDPKKEGDKSQTTAPLQPHNPALAQPAATNNAAPIQGAVSSQFSHPEVARLFNELVSHITAISQKGIREVTITLSSGTFKGSQIILTESSTALRNYNIQLLGATNDASRLFSTHASELMEAFQAKPHPFKINRIDSGHLIRRKEDIDKEGQNGEQEGDS